MKTTADDILNSAVSSLRGMDATLSGDDTPLASVWDEIKDQVQNEQSFCWDVYEETMRCMIDGAIEKAKESNGFEPPPPYCDEDDIEDIQRELFNMLLSRAESEEVECTPLDFTYFCYPLPEFLAYGEVLKRTGISTCEAEVFSVAAPSGEVGTVELADIDNIFSEEDFEIAREKGWPEE